MAARKEGSVMVNRLAAYRDDSVTVHVGDVRKVLRELPAASVDCCVTSPPYWGLRDYGLPPLTWGGDPNCRHQWSGMKMARGGRKAFCGPERTQLVSRVGKTKRQDGAVTTGGRFCLRCTAWLGDLGLEPSPDLYLAHIVEVFRDIRRVLKPTGTVWLNLGDAYCAGTRTDRTPTTRTGVDVPASWSARCQPQRIGSVPGLKPKDLIGLPWRVAFALQADGWYLRADIIWAKPNPMPESVRDRPTKSHEYVFLLSSSSRYFYDTEAVREPAAASAPKAPAGWDKAAGAHGSFHRLGREPVISAERKSLAGPTYSRHRAAIPGGQTLTLRSGRNRRTVWTIATQPFRGAHFATFPERLVEPCILAGTSEAGCCAACGAPWEREVVVAYENPGNRTTNGPRSVGRRSQTPGFEIRLERHSPTRGWHPTCRCPARPVQAVVLDPFAGSGTTLAVAARLGRRAVGIELNPDYLALIKARCALAATAVDEAAAA